MLLSGSIYPVQTPPSQTTHTRLLSRWFLSREKGTVANLANPSEHNQASRGLNEVTAT